MLVDECDAGGGDVEREDLGNPEGACDVHDHAAEGSATAGFLVSFYSFGFMREERRRTKQLESSLESTSPSSRAMAMCQLDDRVDGKDDERTWTATAKGWIHPASSHEMLSGTLTMYCEPAT